MPPNDFFILQNEYIVVNNTKLYESEDIESDVIVGLEPGDKINRIIIDDESEMILVALLNEDNGIEYSGWIKIDDVTLIDLLNGDCTQLV